MDIKKIIEEYDIIFDSMEDETGVNEVGEEKKEIKENLSDKKPNMEQAVYDEIKIKEPEVAEVNDTIAKKLVKQFEDLEIEIKVDGVNPEDVQVNVEGEDTEEESIEEPTEGESEVQPELEESLEDPAKMEKVNVKNIKIKEPEVEKAPIKEEVADKITFKLGDADVEVTNETDEEFTAEEILDVIEKENPAIFFNNADAYHFIMDFSFEKNGKTYWIESKNIEGDFSKFELNIYSGINESKSLLKAYENCEKADIKKAEYNEIKAKKIEVDKPAGLKEEKIDEVSLETAELTNDLRQADYVKKVLDMKASGEEIDREIAKEAEKKLKKNTKLLKKWKKSKGIEESLNEDFVESEDEQYRNQLYNYLDTLSEYHDDIIPEENDSMQNLLDKYFYWVTEYNDNYDVRLEKPETDFDRWLISKKSYYINESLNEMNDRTVYNVKQARRDNFRNSGYSREEGVKFGKNDTLYNQRIRSKGLGIEDGIDNLVNIGFDKLSAYKPSVVKAVKEIMARACELGLAEPYDFGRGKGKYRTDNSIQDVVKGLLDDKTARKIAMNYVNKQNKGAGLPLRTDESLNEEVVARFDEGKHEIVKCDKGYYNRYNIKEGKARFTTKCVESLPTALTALKKRFPKAEEVKESK